MPRASNPGASACDRRRTWRRVLTPCSDAFLQVLDKYTNLGIYMVRPTLRRVELSVARFTTLSPSRSCLR